MSNRIKAGFIQFNPELGNPNKNIKSLASLIESGQDADLLVLPELANSGYNFKSLEQARALAENIKDSRFLNFLIEQAHAHHVYLVAGMNEEEDGVLYNTSVLVGPEGLMGKYRKIHLFWNEFDYFMKGNLGLPVFDIGIAKIGMLICFDWVFPEVWRILALKGADIICHPSNLVLPYAQQAVPVHGMINKTFNITSNRYGSERDVSFSGQSIISDPVGNTLHQAPAKADMVKWLNLDLELARDKQITPRNHVIGDRIPGEYGDLLNTDY